MFVYNYLLVKFGKQNVVYYIENRNSKTIACLIRV